VTVLTLPVKMVILKTMKETMINIGQAKSRLSEYARRVKNGERFILCDRNKPFAELRPLQADSQRPFGLARGRIRLPENFNAPDPEIERLFEGTGYR